MDGSTISAKDLICDAMKNHRVLSFVYNDELRRAEPYILGHDHKDELLLSAVQISGGSGYGFRTFRVEGLSSVRLTARSFSGTRREYNPRDPLFARVICQIEAQS